MATGKAECGQTAVADAGWRPVINASLNVTCSIMGAGMLGLPMALYLAGWAGIFMLVLATAVQLFTGVVLTRCMLAANATHGITTYGDLGSLCFGKVGYYAVLGSQMVTLVGAGILFLVLGGQNMYSMTASSWSGGSPQIWSCLCALVVMPLALFRSMKETHAVALGGVLASLTAAVIVVVGSLRAPTPVEPMLYNDVTFDSVAQSFGIFFFSYGAHAIYPSIMRVMPVPERFKSALYLATPFIFTVYIVTSVVAYTKFGCHVMSNVLLNLEHNASFYVASAAITLHVLAAWPIIMNPVFHVLEASLGVGAVEVVDEKTGRTSRFVPRASLAFDANFAAADSVASRRNTLESASAALPRTSMVGRARAKSLVANAAAAPGCGADQEAIAAAAAASAPGHSTDNIVAPASGKAAEAAAAAAAAPDEELVATNTVISTKGRVASIALRLFGVAFCLFWACLLPFFDDLLSALGGSTITLSTMVLPCAFYIKLNRATMARSELALHLAIIIVATLVGVTSTIFAIKSIVNNASTYELFHSPPDASNYDPNQVCVAK